MANQPANRQQPESLRLRSIMPSFTVNDIDRSVQWYCQGLGFHLAERWEDGGKLKGAGFRIWCETTQDVDAIAKRLRNLGGTITEEPGNHHDSYSFTAQDPDGFKLTIIRAKS
ncbi:MAG: VOC family protein [Gemmatimonadales bacterium]